MKRQSTKYMGLWISKRKYCWNRF